MSDYGSMYRSNLVTSAGQGGTVEPAAARPGASTLVEYAGVGVARDPAASGTRESIPSGLAPFMPGLPAPGASAFHDADGMGWILLNCSDFECIAVVRGREAELHTMVSQRKDPGHYEKLWTAAETQHAIGNQVPGSAKPGANEPSWGDWAGGIIGGITDGIGDHLPDPVKKIWDGIVGGDDPPPPKIAPGTPGSPAIPQAWIDKWVDLATEVSAARHENHNKLVKVPYKPDLMDQYLLELSRDQAMTKDPIQLSVLAGVQFQFESAKRGTDYQWGGPRDYDLDGSFDCSEAVQWMLMQVGLGDLFGEATNEVATPYMQQLIKSVFKADWRTDPQVGDIMMWSRHVGMVAAVRPDEKKYYVSEMAGSGSKFVTYDLNDPIGSASKYDQALGFWAPTGATLPAAIGFVTVKAGGKGTVKYSTPDMPTANSLGEWYAHGEVLELLEIQGNAYLVHHLATRSAAWVHGTQVTRDDDLEVGDP